MNAQAILGLSQAHIEQVHGKHFLQAEVRDAFLNMQHAASQDNVDIQICSSFRPFERQLTIWNKKWRGELPVYAITGEIVNVSQLSPIDKIHAIMMWSALPGASRHHWGTDFDVYDKQRVDDAQHDFQLIPDEYEGNGPCAKLSDWINMHASTFGFSLPYSKYTGGVAIEPWHLSYQALASDIQSNFDIVALQTQLKASSLLGKDEVLDILPNLVERYTFNRGTIVEY